MDESQPTCFYVEQRVEEEITNTYWQHYQFCSLCSCRLDKPSGSVQVVCFGSRYLKLDKRYPEVLKQEKANNKPPLGRGGAAKDLHLCYPKSTLGP